MQSNPNSVVGKKRKVFLVYPEFQIPLILINIAILAVVLAVIGYQSHRSFLELKEMGVEANLSTGHPYFKFVEMHTRQFYQNLGLGFGVGILSSTFLTLLLSHRLAGPIVRLKRYFEQILRVDAETPPASNATVQPLQFRKSDFFAELAPLVNRAVETLKNKRGGK